MKKAWILAGFILAAATAWADDAMPYDRLGRDNVTVKVKETGSGKEADYQYKAYWGSYDRTETSTKNLAVEVAQVGAQSGEVKVELYFVMKPKGGKPFAVAAQPVTLAAGHGVAEFSGSAEMQRERWVYSSLRDSSGTSIAGWLVRVLRGQRIVGVAFSTESYRKAAENPAELAGMLAMKPQTSGSSGR